MSIRSFEDIAAAEGWTAETQVSVLLDYIRNKGDDCQHVGSGGERSSALSDYCEQRVLDESVDNDDDKCSECGQESIHAPSCSYDDLCPHCHERAANNIGDNANGTPIRKCFACDREWEHRP